MTFLWISLIMIFTTFITLSPSPHTLSMFLILMSILISLTMTTSSMSWLPYILILVFTGGFMILILYTITMTTSSIYVPLSPYFQFLLIPLLTLSVTFISLMLMLPSPLSDLISPSPSLKHLPLTNYFSFLSFMLTIVYLLLILLFLLSLLKKEKSSLRLFK